MFPPASVDALPPPGTYYDILGISEPLLSEQADPRPLIKQAYHRALLRHHPDKSSAHQPASTPSGPLRSKRQTVTIDEIAKAYDVLSSPTKRAEYDRALRLQPAAAKRHGAARSAAVAADFQTGMETVDLDELEYDDAQQVWYRGCRCGNARGYTFAEQDLESEADHGELLVGCQDCSLWLRVHFLALGSDDEGPPGNEQLPSTRTAGSHGETSQAETGETDNGVV